MKGRDTLGWSVWDGRGRQLLLVVVLASDLPFV